MRATGNEFAKDIVASGPTSRQCCSCGGRCGSFATAAHQQAQYAELEGQGRVAPLPVRHAAHERKDLSCISAARPTIR